MKYRLIAIAVLGIAGHPSLMAGYRVIGEGTPEAPYTVPVPVPIAPVVAAPLAGGQGAEPQVLAARVQALETENRELRERLRDAEWKLGNRRAPSVDGDDTASVGFDTGSTSVAQPASRKAEILARARSASAIEIVGYTDNTGSAAINKRIALARAQLVKDMLVKEGIPAQSIRVKEQSGVYYASNDTPEGRAANRRAIVSFR